MPVVSVSDVPANIASAIRSASKSTGTDFGYLLNTAARESNFKETAKAGTSSAAGLFQFLENTWLKTVKEEGPRFGLGDYASRIFKARTGRYYVPYPKQRQEILKLRHDPQVAAVMAGALTQKNAEYVGARIGRAPTQGELYIAHFLGPDGASRFIELAETRPNARAAKQFPLAARANPSIFYEGRRARSVGEVYAELVKRHDTAKIAPPAISPELPVRKPEPAGTEVQVAQSWQAATTVHRARPAPAEEPAALPPSRAMHANAAALAEKTLQTETAAAAAPLGGIGPWQTIVRPTVNAAPVKEAAPVKKAAPVEVAQAKRARAVPAPREPAPPPETPSRAAPPEARVSLTSSSFRLFTDDFWDGQAQAGA